MTDINGDPYTVLTNLSVDRLLVNGSPVAGGAAAGPNDSVQFNLSGNFTGDASFKWDNTGKVLSVIGSITATSINGISLTTGGSVDDSLRGDGTYQTITAGADTQLQFNNSGSLAGSANLTWDGLVLAVTGGITATTFNSIALTNGGAGNNYLDDSGSYSPATAGPAGANTQVQYNDAGTLGADANFTWDGFTLSITGAVIGTTFNSVALTNGGSVVNLLREDGTYNPLAWGEISGTLSNQIDLQVELDAKKNDFAENTAFNKNFGTSAGTVLEGNTVLGGAVDSVTGDGVGGTAVNPVMSFPVPSDIGLGNVDNTSDANKPVSTAQQTALNLKLNLSGGAMTGPVTSVSSWTGTSFNGVALTTGGSATNFLDEQGNYNPVSTSSAWGSITGTLSSQTDLQTALDAKLNLSGGAITGPVTSISTWTGTSFNSVALTTGAGAANALTGAGTYVAFVSSVSEGENISIDNTDPSIPIINQILPKVLSDNAIDVNTTTSFSDKINDTFVGNKAGDYRIHFETNQSYDATNSSIIFRAEIDGTLQGTSNEVFRMEPQDSGGGDGDGRGTSQKHIFKQSYPFTLAADGDIDVVFSFAGSAGGVEAAMWNTSITLEKVENV